MRPLFLLADSQLLFWREKDGGLMDRVAAALPSRPPRAAYLGASNGDRAEFYDLFLAAVEPLAPAACRHVPAVPSEDNLAFLDTADLIVLGGGDVHTGWRAMDRKGVTDVVRQRYRAGAVLLGVSAGAVQLGAAGWWENWDESLVPFDTFGFAPFVVDAHAEGGGWRELRTVVASRGEGARGIGLPTGGGAIVYPDGTVDPIRHPAHEWTVVDGELSAALLLPRADAER